MERSMDILEEIRARRREKDWVVMMASFNKEFAQILATIKASNPSDWEADRKISNMISRLLNKFQDKVDASTIGGKVMEALELITEEKFFKFSWDLLLRHYFEVNKYPGTIDPVDAETFREVYFEDGMECDNVAGKLILLMKQTLFQFVSASKRDGQHLTLETCSVAMNTLISLRCLTQLALLRIDFGWIVYNGTIHIYKVARQLSLCQYQEDMAPFYLWAAKCLECAPSLSGVGYLPWKCQLMIATANSLYKSKEFSRGVDILESTLSEVQDTTKANLDVSEDLKMSINCMLERLNVAIYKQKVFLIPQTKPSDTKNVAKRYPYTSLDGKPWPRTFTEINLDHLFEDHGLKLQALLMALSARGRPVLDTLSPQPVETYNSVEVYGELFAAAKYLIFETEMGTQVSAAVSLAKLAFNYEQWELCASIVSKMFEYQSTSGGTSPAPPASPTHPGRTRSGLRSVLLGPTTVTMVELLLLDALLEFKNSSTFPPAERQREADSAVPVPQPTMPQLRLAWLVESCLDLWSEVDLDRSFVVQVSLLLWSGVHKAIFKLSALGLFQRFWSGSLIKWKTVVRCVWRVVQESELHLSDPIVAAEVALRYADMMEGTATAAGMTEMPSVLQTNPEDAPSPSHTASHPTASLYHRGTSLLLQQQEDFWEELQATPAQRLQKRLSDAHEAIRWGMDALATVRTMRERPGINSPSAYTQLRNTLEGKLPVGDDTIQPPPFYKPPLEVAMDAMLPDLHLEMLSMFIRLHLKLASVSEVAVLPKKAAKEPKPASLRQSFATIVMMAGRSSKMVEAKFESMCVSRAFYLLHLAMLACETGSHDPKQIRDWAEEAIQQLHKYESEIKRIGKGGFSEDPALPVWNKPYPPQPELICRSTTSFWFQLPVADVDTKIQLYRVFAKIVDGLQKKVRLGDAGLVGTGVDIPITCRQFCVDCLQPFKFYAVAVAWYDINGNLIGDRISESTPPIQASYTFPVGSAWALATQLLYSLNLCEQTEQCVSTLWHHCIVSLCGNHKEEATWNTVGAVPVIDSPHPYIHCQGIVEAMLHQATPIYQHLFVIALTAGGICLAKEISNSISKLAQKRLSWEHQVRCLDWSLRLISVLQLARSMGAFDLVIQVAMAVYGLLVPFIQLSMYIPAAVLALQHCLRCLREAYCPSYGASGNHTKVSASPSKASSSAVSNTTPATTISQHDYFLHKSQLLTAVGVSEACGCMARYVAGFHIRQASPQAAERALLLTRDAVRGIFTTDKDSPIEVPNLVSAVLRGEIPKARSCITWPRSYSVTVISALEALWLRLRDPAFRTNITLQGDEDPVVVNHLLANMSSEQVMTHVEKFRGHTHYLEIIVPVLQMAVWEGLNSEAHEWTNPTIREIRARSDAVLQMRLAGARHAVRRLSHISTKDDEYETAEGETIDMGSIYLSRKHKSCKELSPFRETDTTKVTKDKRTGGIERGTEATKGPKRKLPFGKDQEITENVRNFLWRKMMNFRRRIYLRKMSAKDLPQIAQVYALQGVAKLMLVMQRQSALVPEVEDDEGYDDYPYRASVRPDWLSLKETGSILVPAYDWLQMRLPQMTEDVTSVADDVRMGCLYFRRAIVLSHRHGLWALFLTTCVQLVNCSNLLLTCLRRKGSTAVISPNVVKSELWRPFFYAADCFLESTTKLYEHQQMINSDRKWLFVKVTFSALELLYLKLKMDRVLHIGLRFIAATSCTYVEQLYPFLIHCRCVRLNQLKAQNQVPVSFSPSRSWVLPPHLTTPEQLLAEFDRRLQTVPMAQRSAFHARRLLLLYLAQQPLQSQTDRESDFPFGNEIYYLPPLSTKATFLNREDLCRRVDLYSNSSHATFPPVLRSAVIAAYSKAIDHSGRSDVLMCAELLNELGCFQCTGNELEQAVICWRKVLGSVLGTQNVEKVIQLGLQQPSCVDIAGGDNRSNCSQLVSSVSGSVFGCLVGAGAAVKLARYGSFSSHTDWIRHLLTAASLFRAVLSLSVAHSSSNLDPPLVPGLCLWFDQWRCSIGDLLSSLHWLAKHLLLEKFPAQVLPLTSLYDYASRSQAMSYFDVLRSDLLRLHALMDLRCLSGALKTLQQLAQREENTLATAMVVVDKFQKAEIPLPTFEDYGLIDEPRQWQALYVVFDHASVQGLIEAGPVDVGNSILLERGRTLSILRTFLSDFPQDQHDAEFTDVPSSPPSSPLRPGRATPPSAEVLRQSLQLDADRLLQMVPNRIALLDPELAVSVVPYMESQLELARHLQASHSNFLASLLLLTLLLRIQNHKHLDGIYPTTWLEARLCLSQALMELPFGICDPGNPLVDPLKYSFDGAAEAQMLGHFRLRAEFLLCVAKLLSHKKDVEPVLQEALESLNKDLFPSDENGLVRGRIMLNQACYKWTKVPQSLDAALAEVKPLQALFRSAMDLLNTQFMKHGYPAIDAMLADNSELKLNGHLSVLPLIVHCFLGEGVAKMVVCQAVQRHELVHKAQAKFLQAIRLNNCCALRSPWIEACVQFNLATGLKLADASSTMVLRKFCKSLRCLFVESVDVLMIADVCKAMADVAFTLLRTPRLKEATVTPAPTKTSKAQGSNPIPAPPPSRPDSILQSTLRRFLFLLVSEVAIAMRSSSLRAHLLTNLTTMSINVPDQALRAIPQVVLMDLCGRKAVTQFYAEERITTRIYDDALAELQKLIKQASQLLMWPQVIGYYEQLYRSHEQAYVERCRKEFAVRPPTPKTAQFVASLGAKVDTPTFTCVLAEPPDQDTRHIAHRIYELDAFFCIYLPRYKELCEVPVIHVQAQRFITAIETHNYKDPLLTRLGPRELGAFLHLELGSLCYYWHQLPTTNQPVFNSCTLIFAGLKEASSTAPPEITVGQVEVTSKAMINARERLSSMLETANITSWTTVAQADITDCLNILFQKQLVSVVSPPSSWLNMGKLPHMACLPILQIIQKFLNSSSGVFPPTDSSRFLMSVLVNV